MPKRTPDQWRYWSEINKLIGHKLRAHYQACTTEELPPRLLALLKKLDEKIEASAEQVVAIQHSGKF
jgi:Anti-sigma factor NepR